jgi:hypothetical protein
MARARVCPHAHVRCLPVVWLGPRGYGPSGRQCRKDTAEHGRLDLPHDLANRLHLARARPVRAHALRRYHGLVQGLRQLEPDQLGSGQGDELDPERL